ncbi:MAG: SHOCT domain-containing protein [Syntrophales bacterium]
MSDLKQKGIITEEEFNAKKQEILKGGQGKTNSGVNLSNATQQVVKPKWYDKKRLVLLLCIIVWPVGLFGLWKSNVFPKGWKAGVTLMVLLAIIMIANSGGEKREKRITAEGVTSLGAVQKNAASAPGPTPAPAPAPPAPSIANIDPQALGEIFNMMSKHTNVQRENAKKEIIGKTVRWQLPVYEVSKIKDNLYKVITKDGANVGTATHITTRNSQEIDILESLKTDDQISFIGTIVGVIFPRLIEIKPAVLD